MLRDWLIGKGWLQSLDGAIPSPVYVAPRAPQQPARPPAYLPAADVDRLWRASWQLTDPRCQAVPFLSERRFLPHAQVIAALDLARIAPTHIPGGWSESEAWPSWWSAGRAPTWRLVVRGWGPGGAVGFHGRAVVPTPVIDGKALPKALWARGYDSSGLLFWNRHPVAEAEAIFIAEGLTDWLTLSIWAAQRPVAVFGGTSGSWRGLIPVGKRAKPGADIVVAVDADAKGNEYAKAILAAFPGRRVFRTKPVSLGLSESDLHEHAEAAK